MIRVRIQFEFCRYGNYMCQLPEDLKASEDFCEFPLEAPQVNKQFNPKATDHVDIYKWYRNVIK